MTKAYGKGPKGRATALHSQLVRSRGRCEKCGGTDYLQAAHIVGRKFAATRTDETNAFCLCARCHARFTDWPLEFVQFIHATIGEQEYARLREKALSNRKPWKEADWQAECERLSALLKAVA